MQSILVQSQTKLFPVTPASHAVSSDEKAAQPSLVELPMCTYDLPGSFEVRISRPFHPFQSKREVPIQTCEELQDAIPPKYVLLLGGQMPEHLDWDQAKVEKG